MAATLERFAARIPGGCGHNVNALGSCDARTLLGYDVESRTIHELLVAAAKATDRIAETPEPFVLQTSLDDFYVTYELNAYTREPSEMPQIYSDLHQNIQDGLHAGGIEIASPHLSAVRDGNRINVPGRHLPQDYEPASFRVHPIPGLPGGPMP